jgi:2,4-dienoyl-CoA reductase-like NADH-dependent reductase (Old Yellow Enzyme family)
LFKPTKDPTPPTFDKERGMDSKLFETSFLGGLIVKNRFVRSATWEGLADEDGTCSGALIAIIRELAQGGVGLIISSHAFVSPEGQAGPRRLAVYDDRFTAGLMKLAEAAHAAGSKIVLQLAHAGLQADTLLTKQDAVGPSSLPSCKGAVGRAMTVDEIEQTVAAFARAAERAQVAGFDGVQLHAAHGYLLSQFSSPYFNRRTDEFGGSVEKRARLALMILQRIKATCGDRWTVLAKLNSEDFIEGGLTVGESLQIARMLEHAGIDGIEMSGGTGDAASRFSPIRPGELRSEDREVYYREAARRFKAIVRTPLILVGGIRSYAVAEELVEDGVADYISLSRPLIREPQLIARWKSGDTARSACGSCNLCFQSAQKGHGVYCVAERRQLEKESFR